MKLTFARFLMLGCVVLSGGLGVVAYSQHQDIQGLRSALSPNGKVEDLTRRVQTLSRQHSELLKQQEGDPLTGGEKTPESYVRSVAYHKNVQIGLVNFTPSTRDYGSFVDRIYRITPTDKDAAFTRPKLANFFFRLEEASKRVRVTEIELETASKKVKPEDVPDDRWRFKAQVTLRQKNEKP